MANAFIVVVSLLFIGVGAYLPYAFDRQPEDWVFGGLLALGGLALGCACFGIRQFGLFFAITSLAAIASRKGWLYYKGGQQDSFYAFGIAAVMAIADVHYYPIIFKVIFWAAVVLVPAAAIRYNLFIKERIRNARNGQPVPNDE